MTSEALSLWLRWAGEWTARAWFPFDPERRDQVVEALSNYRWASELFGDAALIRTHGADDAVGWLRHWKSSDSKAPPWAAPAMLGLFYAHGVMRRSLEAPRLIASAVDAWMEGNRELVRAFQGKNHGEDQPEDSPAV